MINTNTLEKRYYDDPIDEVRIEFYSNAEQSLIDALRFNGFWVTVRYILTNWGYDVHEISCLS